MFEPRGHADMYGAVLKGQTLPEMGIVKKEGDEFELKIDAPR